jgi:hypothetical protein
VRRVEQRPGPHAGGRTRTRELQVASSTPSSFCMNIRSRRCARLSSTRSSTATWGRTRRRLLTVACCRQTATR